MKEEKELLDIAAQVKGVEEGINGMIIPILKDTIADGNKHNTRLFILAIIELVVILITVLVSIFFIYRQNIKYQEFLNQFDFESEYVQDLDATDGGDIVNTKIETNK